MHTEAPKSSYLIFTDLDGTLLDHDSYDWSPAKPALQALRQRAIPTIPVSSKTSAELEPFCRSLGFDNTYVAENGTVIQLPGASKQIIGPGIDHIRVVLARLRIGFGWQFSAFGDMDEAQVRTNTGLSLEDAARALQREATEPVLWLDSEENMHHFGSELAQHGLKMLQGGRFLHVLGDGDKGSALRKVAAMLDPDAHTIALGDSPNDRDLLLAADTAVIIKRKHAPRLELPERTDVIHAPLAGPAGWNQVILQLLQDTPIKPHG